MIHESYTSVRCHNCRDVNSECKGEHLQSVSVSLRNGNYSVKPTHSRVMCKSCLDKGINTVYNRDTHAAKNIYRLAYSLMHDNKRPDDLQKKNLPISTGTTNTNTSMHDHDEVTNREGNSET